MAPDLNSLPDSHKPSLSSSSSPSSSSYSLSPNNPQPMQSHPTMPSDPGNINTPPSPHSPSLSSLQAAASINAGIRNSPDANSPRFERRRSSLMMNLYHNNPSIPSPGEMVSTSTYPHMPEIPQHHRAPSLGEIHQQSENEQEAQVIRLLRMIRSQQEQIDSLQAANAASSSDSPSQAPPSTQGAAAIATTADSATSRSRTSSVGLSLNALQQQQQQHQHQQQQQHHHQQSTGPRSPLQRPSSLSRQSSSRVSASGGPGSNSQSPMLPPLSSSGTYDPHREDWLLGGARDEGAFYQAETQMLTRENQMLKQRIRELERQLGHLGTSSSSPSTPHQPTAISPLASPPALPESQPIV